MTLLGMLPALGGAASVPHPVRGGTPSGAGAFAETVRKEIESPAREGIAADGVPAGTGSSGLEAGSAEGDVSGLGLGSGDAGGPEAVAPVPSPISGIGGEARVVFAPAFAAGALPTGEAVADTIPPTGAPSASTTDAVPEGASPAPSASVTDASATVPSAAEPLLEGGESSAVSAAGPAGSASGRAAVPDPGRVPAVDTAPATGAAAASASRTATRQETADASTPTNAAPPEGATTRDAVPAPRGTVSATAPEAHRPAALSGAPSPASFTPAAPTTADPALPASSPASAAPAGPAATGPAVAADPLPAALPVDSPAPASASPAVTTAAAASAPARAGLLPQLSAPVIALAQAPDGEHTITLTVSPENLGPVTVRAHVAGGVLHVELASATDAGREALRAILTDLRRDLAAATPSSSLSLGGQDAAADDAPSGRTDQGGDGSPEPGAAGGRTAPGSTVSAASMDTGLETPAPPPASAPTTGIDVFA